MFKTTKPGSPLSLSLTGVFHANWETELHRECEFNREPVGLLMVSTHNNHCKVYNLFQKDKFQQNN